MTFAKLGTRLTIGAVLGLVMISLSFFAFAVSLIFTAIRSPKLEASLGNVRLVLLKQEEAWNKGQLDEFMQGYWKSEELKFFTRNQVEKGWQKIYDRYQKKYGTAPETMGQVAFKDTEYQSLGPRAALVRGRWELERDGKISRGLFTLIVRRIEDGSWKITHDHTSAEEEGS